MSWATNHILRLQLGQTIQFRPKGNSMTGRIDSGNLVTVEPATAASVAIDDVVLCRVGGHDYLHIVKAKDQDGRVQIANNKGRINGWTKTVYGKCIKVEA